MMQPEVNNQSMKSRDGSSSPHVRPSPSPPHCHSNASYPPGPPPPPGYGGYPPHHPMNAPPHSSYPPYYAPPPPSSMVHGQQGPPSTYPPHNPHANPHNPPSSNIAPGNPHHNNNLAYPPPPQSYMYHPPSSQGPPPPSHMTHPSMGQQQGYPPHAPHAHPHAPQLQLGPPHGQPHGNWNIGNGYPPPPNPNGANDPNASPKASHAPLSQYATQACLNDAVRNSGNASNSDGNSNGNDGWGAPPPNVAPLHKGMEGGDGANGHDGPIGDGGEYSANGNGMEQSNDGGGGLGAKLNRDDSSSGHGQLVSEERQSQDNVPSPTMNGNPNMSSSPSAMPPPNTYSQGPPQHHYPPHSYYPPHPSASYGNMPNSYAPDGSDQGQPPIHYHDAYGRPPWGVPGAPPPYGHPSTMHHPPTPYDMNGYPTYHNPPTMYHGGPSHYPPHNMEPVPRPEVTPEEDSSPWNTTNNDKKRRRSNSFEAHPDHATSNKRHEYYVQNNGDPQNNAPPPPSNISRPQSYPPTHLPPMKPPSPQIYTFTTTTNSKSQRRKKKMYSDYVGVTYNKTHAKYQACITHYRKQHYLGRYKLAVDAALAYDESARLLKGPSWKVNFPTRQAYDDAKVQELDSIGRVGGVDFMNSLDVAGSMAAVASKVEELASSVRHAGGTVVEPSTAPKGEFSSIYKIGSRMVGGDAAIAQSSARMGMTEEELHKKTPGALTQVTDPATPAMTKVTPSPNQASPSLKRSPPPSEVPKTPKSPLPESPNPTRHAMGTEKSTPDSAIRPKILSFQGKEEKKSASLPRTSRSTPKEETQPTTDAKNEKENIITNRLPPRSPAVVPTKASSKPNTPRDAALKRVSKGTPKSAPPVIQNNTLAAASALMTLFGNEKSE